MTSGGILVLYTCIILNASLNAKQRLCQPTLHEAEALVYPLFRTHTNITLHNPSSKKFCKVRSDLRLFSSLVSWARASLLIRDMSLVLVHDPFE